MELSPTQISGKVPTPTSNSALLAGMNAQVMVTQPTNVEMNATMGAGEIPNLDRPKPTAQVTESDLNGGKTIMAKQQQYPTQQVQAQYQQPPQQVQYQQNVPQQAITAQPPAPQTQYAMQQPQTQEKGGIFDQIDYTSIGIGAVIGAGIGYLVLNND